MCDRIYVLRAQLAAMEPADFGPDVTEILDDPNRAVWPPQLHPVEGQHPRLLFTKDDIPGILANMTAEENAPAVAVYQNLAETETDGILPPPWEHTSGRKGDHNFDCPTLAAIQAKALAYQLTGDEIRGYEAVVAMMNFIRTMEIKWIICDHCREYGYAAYVAACVYDWCYALMDARSRYLMLSGIEHRFFRGSVLGSPTALCGTVKMEVGFPPRGQGVCTGHGSENQILRDYLALSVAIYDEYPSWWDFIAGRVYHEFVPVRNVYYRAGITPQGAPGYAAYRYLGDMYSAWILKAAVGQNPYSEDMRKVVRSFIAREIKDGECFRTGDIYTNTVSGGMSGAAVITDYLYGDSTLRAWARHYADSFSRFPGGVASLSAAEFVILSGKGGRCAADHRSGLSLVTYNPYPLGEVIARNKWDAEDSVIVQMKIGERSTGNHDHADHGHFQIYYKGMLVDDVGQYGIYGTDHHYFFHRGSVGHNTLLVFNPAYADDTPERNDKGKIANRERYWYSGGQRYVGEPQFLHTWMTPMYDFGRVQGEMHRMKSDGTPDFAYIGGDITKAYPANTVDYVGRQMLTVFTGDAARPAVLFIADRVDAAEANFKKSFILQTCAEPVMDVERKSLRYSNGRASLILHALSGADEMAAYGGPGKTYFIPRLNQNLDHPSGTDGWNWGRVELSPKVGQKSDLFLNVLTVADDGVDAPRVAKITGEGIQGAVHGNLAAVFATSTTPMREAMRFTLPAGVTRCFVAGLAGGNWIVRAGGAENIDPVERTNGLFDFAATAGDVEIVRM